MIELDHLNHAYWMLDEVMAAGRDLADELQISHGVILALDANSKEVGQDSEVVFTGAALGLQMGRMEAYEMAQTLSRGRWRKDGRRPA